MKKCRKCGDPLVLGENWLESQKRARAYICTPCNRAQNARWRKENPEKKRALDVRWRKENPEKARAKYVRWRRENPEKVRASNVGARAKMRRTRPDYYAATMGWSAARRRGATLPEDFLTVADLLVATEPIYANRRRLEEETGKKHHVDHILPLIAGGEHHPNNLQVLTAHENRKKRDTFDIPLAKQSRELGFIDTTPELADLDFDEQEALEIERLSSDQTDPQEDK